MTGANDQAQWMNTWTDDDYDRRPTNSLKLPLVVKARSGYSV